jgi:methyl-accepting chemotaxis protein
MNIFSKMSVFARIGVLAGLSALTVAILIATFFYNRSATDAAIAEQQHFAEIERLALEMEIGALQMRRREKDFLLRRDASYLDRYLTEASHVSSLLEELSGLDTSAEVRAAGARLTNALPQHQAAFEHVVSEATRLGLTPNEGLEGSLRAAVRAAESRLAEIGDAELTVMMLMMRRHEKDFMLRVQDRYVDSFDTRQQEFSDLLVQRGYSSAEQTELTTLMASYSRDFHAWADTRLAYNTSVASLSEIFSGMNPDFDGILEAARAGSAESLAQLDADRSRILVLTLVIMASVVALSVGLTWIVGRSIATPVKAITGVMTELAGGNAESDVPHTKDGGEIGQMANAVLVFQQGHRDMQKMRKEQAAAEERTAEERRESRNELAEEFDAQVAGIAQDVAAAATQLISSAGALHGSAKGADERASVVASAAEETSANTQAVASAAEELTSSIREIHRQVSESMELTESAVEEANVTRVTVSGLADAVARINDVVTLIQSIAGQTNLLALNATIEASRAGDAGKGFAVVASEVKALADQTGKATLEIADQIDSIQASGENAISAITSMTETIDRVARGATAIASAVEQQDSAANEISASVAQAAAGTGQVTESIAALSCNVRETDESANEVLDAARGVSGDAERLKAALTGFLDQIRAA